MSPTHRPPAHRLLAVVLVCAMAMSAIGVGAALPTMHNSDTAPITTVAVFQDGNCWEVEMYGDGTQNVSEFYDYRSPKTNVSGDGWGSYGTRDIQENQASQILFHEGNDTVSMVFVHDALEEPHGGTITFTFDNLPADGEWAVEDDPYPDREDNWDHFENGTEADIDWKWSDGRVDGGAFSGVELTNGTAIEIDPGFNEQADKWESWGHARGDNRTENWYLRSANGDVQQLDMTEPIRVVYGVCGENALPMATLNFGQIANSSEIVFRADASYADGTIESYEWDLNGDGVSEATTDTPSIRNVYEEPGTYNVTVRAIAGDGSETSVTERVEITEAMVNDTEPNETTTDDSTTTDDPTMTDPPDTTAADTNAAPTTTEAGSSSGAPGFGIVLAAAVVLVAALLVARRSRH